MTVNENLVRVPVHGTSHSSSVAAENLNTRALALAAATGSASDTSLRAAGVFKLGDDGDRSTT
jgi:hypothetical protein